MKSKTEQKRKLIVTKIIALKTINCYKNFLAQ